MKYYLGAVCLFCLYSCTVFDERFQNNGDFEHPAVGIFLDYERMVAKTESFDEVSEYFSKADKKIIGRAQGWGRLVYSASDQALRNGSCSEIFLSDVAAASVLLHCKGPYTFKSPFGLVSEETMHLRVYIKKYQDEWYISRAGLTHSMPTLPGREMIPRSIGLKFK
jgi:hypothetical protein